MQKHFLFTVYVDESAGPVTRGEIARAIANHLGERLVAIDTGEGIVHTGPGYGRNARYVEDQLMRGTDADAEPISH